VRKFFAVNPSSFSYNFFWECTSPEHSQFTCNTQKGSIQAGKRAEIEFTYVTTSLEQAVSQWVFKIPNQKVEIPFLLLGSSRDVEVAFVQQSVDFGTILMGKKKHRTVILENHEDFQVSFHIDKLSLKAANGAIQVTPAHGTIHPKGNVEISITYAPTTDKSLSIVATFSVKSKVAAIPLAIKGEVYQINSYLEFNGIPLSTTEVRC
jgi:hydrocephalus-inducing protein